MKISVFGLWHLGMVTASCPASFGHEVIGLDFESSTVEALAGGKPPIFEPGLEDLVKQGLADKNLRFTSDPKRGTQKQTDCLGDLRYPG